MSTVFHPPDTCDIRSARAIVCFIHGLGGSATTTWRCQSDDRCCWTHWLAGDFRDIHVMVLDFDCAPSRWLGDSMVLTDRAVNLLELLLVELSETSTPVFLICHSLGGLLAKQMIRTAYDSRHHDLVKLVGRIRGIVFMATPHTGSDVASFLRMFQCILRTQPVTRELERNAAALRDLNCWFRDNCSTWQCSVKSYCETRSTHGVMVVKADSDLGLAGHRPVPVDADHTTISKPTSRSDTLYRSVCHFIRRTLPAGAPPATLKTILKFDGSLDALSDTTRAAMLNRIVEFAKEHPLQVSVGCGCIEIKVELSGEARVRLMGAVREGQFDDLGMVVAATESHDGQWINAVPRVQIVPKSPEVECVREAPYVRGATLVCYLEEIGGFSEIHTEAKKYMPPATTRVAESVVYVRRVLLEPPDAPAYEWAFFVHSNLIASNAQYASKMLTNETCDLFTILHNLTVGPTGDKQRCAIATPTPTLWEAHCQSVRYLLHQSLLVESHGLRIDLAGARRWTILHDW